VAHSGAALAVIAGAIAAVGFLLQGVGNAEAADLLNRTGGIPGGFLVFSAIQGSLLILFGGLAALGTLGIGVGSLQTDWLSRVIGVTVVILALIALALLVLNIQFLALLGAFVFGGASQTRGGVLTARTRPAGGGAAVDLSDTGCGIAPEDQAVLFTPFFTTKANGTGLGLVLTQQIVAEHKGTIHFASQPGMGSAFCIELPAAARREARARA